MRTHAQSHTPILGTHRRSADLGCARLIDVSYRGGLHQPEHAHARASITVVLFGSIQERSSAGHAVAGPMAVLLKPVGAVHADRFGPDEVRTIALDLGPALAAAWGLGENAGPARVRTDAPLLAAAVLRLRSNIDGSEPQLSNALTHIRDEMRLLSPSDHAGHPPNWIRAVRDELAQPDAPSVEALARKWGMHPVSLARAYRRCFGRAPAAHARGARALLAAARIMGSALPLARIAFDLGYADQSHMTRELSALLGWTPGRLRALAAV